MREELADEIWVQVNHEFLEYEGNAKEGAENIVDIDTKGKEKISHDMANVLYSALSIEPEDFGLEVVQDE